MCADVSVVCTPPTKRFERKVKNLDKSLLLPRSGRRQVIHVFMFSSGLFAEDLKRSNRGENFTTLKARRKKKWSATKDMISAMKIK